MIHVTEESVVVEFPAQGGGVVVCRVHGEIDIEARGRLREALAQAAARATAGVVVDCAGLDFADSTLLNALIMLRRQAGARHLRVALAAPTRQLLHLLDLTGTTALLPCFPSRAAAVAALGSAPRAWCGT
ncbi:STAS domain-containing protein [Streptomyces racemochromogenes]|uniref:STAS domain-containing protein n=1 Tax=Streptomyces racemochromogenes TaxID=67353 RepID=A0ABW7PI34_9ACTN